MRQGKYSCPLNSSLVILGIFVQRLKEIMSVSLRDKAQLPGINQFKFNIEQLLVSSGDLFH